MVLRVNRRRAASVIGGLANIAEEYATKRYRSNVHQLGDVTAANGKSTNLEVGLHLHPRIKAALDNPGTTFKGYVIHEDAPVTEITSLYGKSDC